MAKVRTGGGWRAIRYTLKKASEAGGFWSLWKAMRSKNTCKTCALGMGGQAGGMVNESGHFKDWVIEFAGQLVKPKDDDESGVGHMDADIEVLKSLQATDVIFKKENIWL